MPTRSADTAGELVRAALGTAVRSSAPLAGGTYNAVHDLVLDDGRRAVLKVAPPPDRPRMGHEQDLLSAEAMFDERARGALGGVLPEVLAHGSVPGEPGREYLLLGHLPGSLLNQVDLAAGDRKVVRRELGQAVARLHTVTGSEFGYLTQPRLRAPTWPAAFGAMVEEVVADADRYGVELPAGGGAAVLGRVRSNLGHLEVVRTPILVHFDLWDGNVLVGDGAGPPRLTGIIDAERAFWGDPVAELVSLALTGDIRDDAALLEGYREAGGAADLGPPALRRLALYRIYLWLIMLTETTPRGYDRARTERVWEWVGRRLQEDLAEIAAPVAG
ncbi:phosphotransferase family protein [Georgenia alba]|uniref:Phosphotransferase family protein n=1 Tax=Georgenia alba TaxID=2233858 RepID=A0ABW2Q447_9MICO